MNDGVLGLVLGIILGILLGFVIFLKLAKNPELFKKEGYEQGQTDYAKGIIKYQCDTLKTGELHCYKLQND